MDEIQTDLQAFKELQLVGVRLHLEDVDWVTINVDGEEHGLHFKQVEEHTIIPGIYEWELFDEIEIRLQEAGVCSDVVAQLECATSHLVRIENNG